MITLPANATDEEILDVVRKWASALARQDYEAAFAMTTHDPYYRWTPDLIKAVIQGYGLPEPRWDGKIFQVTPIETAVGGPPPRHEVEYFEQPRPISETGQMAVGEVWFDLPLNGEWSDLTATFEICRSNDCTVLILNEIHVF
jgi:hypothetical protein